MASLTTIGKTPGCGACDGFDWIMHTQHCPHNPNFDADATAQSIKEAAEKARKEKEYLATARAAINIETLTYNIIDDDRGNDGSYDKEITVQLNDHGKAVAKWSVYFNLAVHDANKGGRGENRRFWKTAHLGHNLYTEPAYRGLKLSRFMGKILAEKIEGMIEAKKLRRDDIFWSGGDVTGGFWESIGMTTSEERNIPHQFGMENDDDDSERWCYVGEFIEWANGTKVGTTRASRKALIYHTDVIKEDARKKSSFSGGRKKRTRKKIKRKRRKTRRKSKKKRKRKTRKNKQFLYNPNNPKKSFDVYIDKNPKDTIPIKYTTVKDVKNTIKKLEKLFKTKKYPHKRIWQVGMIMKVRLEAMLKHKTKKYPNAKKVKQRFNIANKYFKFLGDRTNKKTFLERKKMKFLL